MTETTPTSLKSEPMHWALSYLQNDLKEMKQDQREFRREAQEFRKEVAQQFAQIRQEMRHQSLVNIAVAGMIVGVLMTYMEYRFPAG